MYEYEYSLDTDATAAAIYQLYSDVSLWSQWDTDLEHITLDGAFVAGAQGVMKLVGQEPLTFTLTDVQPGVGFTDETVIPGAGLIVRFAHILSKSAEGRTRITHRVTATGAGADEIGSMITADVPQAVAALAAHALSRQS